MGRGRRSDRCPSTSRPAAAHGSTPSRRRSRSDAGFFDAAFEAVEYDPDRPLAIGPLTIRFVRGRHYVPAWGVVVDAPDGSRLAYTGDTGPSDAVVDAVRGADLLLVEAALRQLARRRPGARPPDGRGGHRAWPPGAGARSALLVHYAPSRRAELEALCARRRDPGSSPRSPA